MAVGEDGFILMVTILDLQFLWSFRCVRCLELVDVATLVKSTPIVDSGGRYQAAEVTTAVRTSECRLWGVNRTITQRHSWGVWDSEPTGGNRGATRRSLELSFWLTGDRGVGTEAGCVHCDDEGAM